MPKENKKVTPMMKQYLDVKKQYPGTIVLFRMGDFYEMFNEDAVEASQILNLTLTKRDKKNNIPMCGVPHHAVEAYIGRLLKNRKRVAICDQVEDPKKAKGIVKREVTRVVTPSTTFDERQLSDRANNFLVALYPDPSSKSPFKTGLAVLDVTTGTFEVTELSSMEELRQELVRIHPEEIVIPPHFPEEEWENEPSYSRALVVSLDDFYFDDGRNVLLNHFKVLSLEGFGCEKMSCGISAAGAALRYVQENLPVSSLSHIHSLRVFSRENHMVLDDVSRRNLELTRAMRDGSTNGTLLGVLDDTATSMGGRLLRNWINSPLLEVKEIVKRQNALEMISQAQFVIPKLKDALKQVMDIERLTSRLSTGYGNPRDLAGLRGSLHTVPQLRELVHKIIEFYKSQILDTGAADDYPALLESLLSELSELPELTKLLEYALVDDPPLKVNDGNIIKEGFNSELDELRTLSRGGKDWIAKLQLSESERTGIKSLKVGYNKVFGYYIEVTKTNLHLVPEEYIRKQTISTGERYVTPELKEMESRILNADERANKLEYDLFQELRMRVAAENEGLQMLANAVATLDVLQNLSWLALQRNYCRPSINDTYTMEIKGGRHPVVECLLPEQQFVPNDTLLNTTDSQIVVLTGPNMSGKSTYIRQVALLTLMAQIGSFIPADEAVIGVVDRIFTRVGASDELTRGQSTFMVEMSETANILNNATSKSLIILDEIGRGTSTYDGLSIAWAVVEYIHNCKELKAKTLFATHYHELVQLEHQLSGVVNYNVAVREYENDVVFLHEIVRGGTDKSYGIHVAKLAGIPGTVIDRAKEILQHLESSHQEKAKSVETSSPPLNGDVGGCKKVERSEGQKVEVKKPESSHSLQAAQSDNSQISEAEKKQPEEAEEEGSQLTLF